MSPHDPNEPLPTTPVEPAESARPAPPPSAAGGSWSAPAGSSPAGAYSLPPSPPPKRDRLALFIVAFIFGGLFLVFFGFLILAYSAARGEAPSLGGGPRVGVIELRGVIGAEGGVDGERTMKEVRRFAEDESLKGVVLRIDSPGGAVGPTQEIFTEVKRLAKKKTVVCSMGNLAASGGFYIAMACPKIVAAPGTLTGSIGVIMQFPNVKGLADKIGVDMQTVKSGKLKDAGNPFRSLNADDRAYFQSLADSIHDQFIRAVVDSRKRPEEEVRKIADGRVLSGAEAKEAGLIDELGNFYDAIDLVKTEAKLSGEPTLVYPPEERSRFLSQLLGGTARALVAAVREGVSSEARDSATPGLYFLAR